MMHRVRLTIDCLFPFTSNLSVPAEVNSELLAENERLRAKIRALTNEPSSISRRLDLARLEIEELRAENKRLAKRVQELEGEVAQLSTRVQELGGEVAQLSTSNKLQINVFVW